MVGFLTGRVSFRGSDGQRPRLKVLLLGSPEFANDNGGTNAGVVDGVGVPTAPTPFGALYPLWAPWQALHDLVSAFWAVVAAARSIFSAAASSCLAVST